MLNIVKVPNTIPQAHALYEPNWSLYQYGKVAEMLRNGLYAEIPATLTNIACITVLLLQASGKTDMTARLLSPLADAFLL